VLHSNDALGCESPLTAARETLPFIKHFRETFDSHNRLINAWLDARTPTDYLEARTLKYVVVVESLNALTLRTDKTIAKTVRDSSVWKEIYQKHIAPALPAYAANWLTLSNWQRLNERSFRDTLEAVCRVHGVTLPLKDVSLFGSVRNAIVHRFDYNYSVQLPSRWIMPDHVQAAQHFFAAEFVDRIILQLFGLQAYLKPTDAT
jgi:hypothetical protein